MRNWIGPVLFIGCSIAFVLMGFVNQSKVLTSNKCAMTYSQPQFERVKMESQVKEYHLYIHGTADMLNSIPVLFIPGNSGSAKQVRSFASATHNSDEKFQYFALHFENAMSATHGSVVLKQAAFLNDALAAILSLYESQDQGKGDSTTISNGGGVEVILLAHSAGGLVARTALLLSNHPFHSVNSIVMLGSPNMRPTYTPDVSLDILYKRVNLAWRRSMYPTTTSCQAATLAAHGVQHGDTAPSVPLSDLVELPSPTLTASWDCSVHVPRTRLVSISGGEIDMEVPTPLTSLASLAPRPQNTSMETPEPQKLSTFLKPKGGYVRWVFVNILALPRHMTGLTSGLARWALGTNTSTPEEEERIHDVPVNTSSILPPAPYVFNRMEDIPQDHWDTHIMSYVEPQHVSVRTSQLAGVGFPVDHKALLWCKQLLQTTTRIMSRLASIPTNVTLTGGEMSSKIVKMKSTYALPSWPAEGDDDMSCTSDDTSGDGGVETDTSTSPRVPPVIPIASVQEELRRTAAKSLFSRVALDDERRLLLGILTGYGSKEDLALGGMGIWDNLAGSLNLLSFAVVTAHLPTVLTCYVAISLLVMATFVLYFSSARNRWSISSGAHLYSSRGFLSELALLLPENHLCLNAFVDLNLALLPSFVTAPFIGASGGKTWWCQSGVLLAAILAIVVLYVTHSTQSPIDFVSHAGLFVQWLVSYGVALGLHICVLVALHGTRNMVRAMLSALRTVLRATVWSKPVRRLVRPRILPLTCAAQRLYDIIPAVEWIVVSSLALAMAACSVYFSRQSTEILAHLSGTMPYAGFMVQAAALLYLLSCALFLGVLLTAIVCPQAGASRMLSPVIALSILGIPLGVPTLKFCLDLFSLAPQSYMTTSALSNLLDLFGPDLINYSLSVLFMALNLLYLQRFESTVLPVAFLFEIFDAAKRARAGDGRGFLSSVFSGGGCGACVHEDGGTAAVFEENEKGVSTFCGGRVLLGPALRVISCDCSMDKSLKSFGEWCEWCRCAHCGGKTISRTSRDRAGGPVAEGSYFGTAARTSLGMRDITSDLLVLALLLVGTGYALMNAAAEPFRLFLVLGGMSAVMCAARIFRYGGY